MVRLVVGPQPLRVPLPDKMSVANVGPVLPVTTIDPDKTTVEQLIPIVIVPEPENVPRGVSVPVAVIVVVNVGGQQGLL